MESGFAPQSNQLIGMARADVEPFDLKSKLLKIAKLVSISQSAIHSQFDWKFYIQYNDDLANLSTYEAAYEHWIIFGQIEGRLSSQTTLEQQCQLWQLELPEDFDYSTYLELNLDLAEKLSDHPYKKYKAIEHFLQHGRDECRPYQNLFDWKFYVNYYEDLEAIATPEAAYSHWQKVGQSQGRFTSIDEMTCSIRLQQNCLPEHFEFHTYLELNPDLQQKFANCKHLEAKAIEHYLEHGRDEGRFASVHELDRAIQQTKLQLPSDFEYETYLELNQDLEQDCLQPKLREYMAIEHYLKYGNQERRPYRLLEKPQHNYEVALEHHKSVNNTPDGNRLFSSPETKQANTRLIAFYLPQFHPIPENDRWWGKGFTEWTNVSKAQPLFDGHYQPHFPADLGFYDLRLPEVREMQADLARSYGIHGFCYYYYWFAGKRLLNRPLDDVLASKKPDFPFCICWANENWTRRWDGQENEVLIAQDFSDEQNQAFAESVIPILRDDRYIRVNGLPLLVVYRADIFPDALRTTKQWRETFRQHGIGEVYLAIALTCFSGLLSGLTDPTTLGFDAAVQFAPHEIPAPEIPPPDSIVEAFSGKFYDYKAAAINAVSSKIPEAKVFFSAMPSWDNTARRKHTAHAFLNSNPQDYEFWLRGAIEKSQQHHTGDEQLVFINAWNEWAEGAHLEPDQKYGHDFLIATHRALHGTHSWQTIINLLKYFPFSHYAHLCELLDQLEMRIKRMNQSLAATQKLLSQEVATVVRVTKAELPAEVLWSLDSLYSQQQVNLAMIELQGWVFSLSAPVCTIDIRCNNSLIDQVPVYLARLDVANHLSQPTAKNCGFYAQIDISKQLSSRPELNLWANLQNGHYIELGSVFLETLNRSNSPFEQQADTEYSLIAQIKTLHAKASEPRIAIVNELETLLREKEELIKAGQSALQNYSVHHFFERF